VTIKNRYLIPWIDDMLDELEGETMFSKIDLRSRYRQVHSKEEDIYKTLFLTSYGHHEFVVFSFGSTNSIDTFMFLMNSVLCPYFDKFVIEFIDDIFLYSKNEEERVEHLATLLILLRENHFYVKLNN